MKFSFLRHLVEPALKIASFTLVLLHLAYYRFFLKALDVKSSQHGPIKISNDSEDAKAPCRYSLEPLSQVVNPTSKSSFHGMSAST